MKTVSIAVDERLLKQIDAVAQARRPRRSELFCEAARQWLKQQQIKALVKQERKGSRKQPVQPEEFGPLIRRNAGDSCEPDEIWNFRFDRPDKQLQ